VAERLDAAECLRLISAGGIGRLAYAGAFGLAVLPVSYKLHEGTIAFRTAQDSPTGDDLRTGIAGAACAMSLWSAGSAAASASWSATGRPARNRSSSRARAAKVAARMSLPAGARPTTTVRRSPSPTVRAI